MAFRAETYSKAEKKTAIGQLRKTRAEAKAWKEDNEQRERDNQPRRTLLQYQADNAPPPPSPSKEHGLPPPGKPKMFDPRDPPADRLPKIKILRAKTEADVQAVSRSRARIADPRRTGVMRAADEIHGAARKKLKTEGETACGLKRKADDQDASPRKKTIGDMYPGVAKTKAVKKPAGSCGNAGNMSPAGSKPRAVEVRETSKVESTTPVEKENVDGKSPRDGKSKSTAVVKSTLESTEVKVEQQQQDTAVKSPKAEPLADATVATDVKDCPIKGQGEKRKSSDEIAGPAKRAKLECHALRNYRQACFINASMQLLHSIPIFAAMGNEDNDVPDGDSNLTEEEMRQASGSGHSRQKEELRTKLRNHLRAKAEQGELELTPHLNHLMALLSSDQEGSEINPFLFQQVCGTLLTEDEDRPMNGDSQQDAHEFILALLAQVARERPDLDIQEVFETEFAEQQVCECGQQKTFTERGSTFVIPEQWQKSDDQRGLSPLIAANLDQIDSKFKEYRCDQCGETGKWSTKEGWVGKRMTTLPEYVIAHISRGQFRFHKGRMEELKLATRIVPPVKKMSFPAIDGTPVNYNLAAMIKHHGKDLHRGHYTTIRKVGDEWRHCNDAGRGGIEVISHQQVGTHVDGCIFLLKKA